VLSIGLITGFGIYNCSYNYKGAVHSESSPKIIMGKDEIRNANTFKFHDFRQHNWEYLRIQVQPLSKTICVIL